MKNIALYMYLIVLGGACSVKGNDKEMLSKAFEYAGSNANELKEVLEHYSKAPGDSLKLQAATFLIGNMPGKGYVKYTAVNDCGAYTEDIFTRGAIGVDSINKQKKKIEDSLRCGVIRFTSPAFMPDAKVISAQQLIEDIDYAFKAWKLPWAKNLTFDQFKEYILPYRVQSEPLQKWRKTIFEDSKWMFDKIGNITDRIKIASIVNDSLKVSYHYAHDGINYFPGTFTLKQLQCTQGGRCEDLNMLLGYLLRAIGIPTATEFTSYWGNSNYGGHSWLSVLDTTGKFVPMNSVYDNPVRDSLPFKGAHLAKAYRNTYNIEGVENYGADPFVCYYDITKEYMNVADYKFDLTSPISSKVFLGVLNGEFWKPLDMKTIKKKDRITFPNMATGVLYAPIVVTDDQNKSVKTVGRPFLVSKDGSIQYFEAKKELLSEVAFDISQLSESLYKKKCQVVYWDNIMQRWLPAGAPQQLNDNPKALQRMHIKKYFTFTQIPNGGIYRLIDSEKVQDDKSWGRPFVFDVKEGAYIDY